ncbi:SAM-dependent MidA family methyltransferase [Cytobacillus eiseniae]|uniref:SAM-dependent MidA family methyltransferase n=1 Tax=Cytobacillus eiseniae TaxID=762947 RepID=A0ABS4RD94_9BACI|nr:SAM-dependent methyltransferase [Cytobacillus eiseniae]MBP2240871.1 SAM-dependent MidA family methyltransferase [Cytobacillus eiseniae]
MFYFLKEYIAAHSQKKISYAEYMQVVLYHPIYGYYMKEKSKIGRNGDFITTSNVSDMYGRSLAKWFFQQAKELKLPFSVCEIGAGTGRFAKAFIDEWKAITTENLQYLIVEESPYHRKLQQEIITFNEGIRQIESLDDVRPFEGLIFSNELFDALPVHVIENKNGQLMEVFITIENEELVEELTPLNNEEIIHYLEYSKLQLKNRQRIEIPLIMTTVVKEMAKVLQRGLILTVDYGYTNEEWMEPARRNGSLRGYYKHQQLNDILKNPGEMDLTSHVHFDSFIKIGELNDLIFVQKWRQDEFLLEIGILEELQATFDPNPFSAISKRNRAIRSLIIPGGISSSFHVILQQKGI